MCNVYEDLDKLVGIMSIDWGLMAEQLTQIGMYMALESADLLTEIADNFGEDCMDAVLELANEAINDGLDELEDFVNTGGQDNQFDVDGLAETLKDSGYIMDCAIKDLNLHVIGKDLGTMISRMLQSQLDPTL